MMSTTIVLKSTTHQFPHRSTSFVGRLAELSALNELLQNPACRLLTLVGPGGVGKTRLAIEAAIAALPHFADGLCFAELDEVYTASALVSTLLDGLEPALPGHVDPQSRLYEYFSTRSMLLVLDNFEQLVEVGASVITALLAHAPRLKLLVTSREVLSLEEEWLYPVQGLTLSNAPNVALEESDAIQLFADRVARIRRDFSLTAEQEHVKLICQLVEGAPLAIELAASWARTLTCAEIATEIQHNLDFLTTNLRNLPLRHRNMQAVFAQSWSLLSTVEQAIFCRLSIFRGGFRRHAAEQVTGATLLLLSKLVDKSLIRWEANGRYQIHGLLRQYSLNRLQADPAELQRLQAHHCAYYTQLLNRPVEADFRQPNHPLVQEIRMEWDNIYAAWLWALQERAWDALEQMAQPLAAFLQAQSRYQDSIDLFVHALTHLRATSPTQQTQQLLAYLLAVRGHGLLLLGKLDSAESTLQESRQLYQQMGFPHRPGLLTDPVLSLSIIAWMRSDFAAARDYGAEGHHHAALENNPYNLGYAHIMLSGAYYALGDYGATRVHAHQAFALIAPLEDRWLLASAQNELGKVAMVEGDFTAAARHFQASYTLRQELGHLQGMAMARMLHGENERRRAHWDSAEQLFAEALPLYEKTGDQKGIARTVTGLAEVAAAQQRHVIAREQFKRALAIVENERLATYAGVVLVGLGEWLLVVGDHTMGQRALAAVIANKAGTADLRLRAEQILQVHGLAQSDRSQPILLDMMRLVQQLRVQITTLPLPPSGAPSLNLPSTHLSTPAASTAQPLIEPLTPRELEVLALIAQGLSNQAIADQLVITLGTVKSYTAAIYGKLGVRSRTQAIALARELKLLP
jgi:predicted ATPase/DNA-binding NarL/FixJ family response regulator